MVDKDLELIVKKTQVTSEFITAYDFEVYDIVGTIQKFEDFKPFMFSTIVIYLLLVYFGQKWMKNRPAFKLQGPLFVWNMGLGIFSIIATIRGFPECAHLLSKPDGTYLATCSAEKHNFATSFWGLMFGLSKFVELGDTAFIILRKQKLIVLHWFHHVATLLLCWYGFIYYDAFGRFFIINTFVHSLMYPYYALKVIKISVPKSFSKALTSIQIGQMFVGIYLNFYSFYMMARGYPCQRHTNVVILAGIIIPIFTVLFINFFKETYLRRSPKKTKPE